MVATVNQLLGTEISDDPGGGDGTGDGSGGDTASDGSSEDEGAGA